jgi:hypothetical protein
MKGTIIALLLALLWPFISFSQVKYEREYGVSAKEIPVPARVFAEKAFPEQKIRWYKEEGLESFSFEAKVRRRGTSFSVEFDSLGTIEDVEMLLSFSEIDEPVRKNIEARLGSTFSKYRIQRVQRQLTGKEQALEELVSVGTTGLPFVVRYEIVARGKKDKTTGLYELLFDDQGALLGMKEIIPRNTDILDY